MDKFTITIADGEQEGFARAAAEALMKLAAVVVPQAVARAAARSDCQCEKCKAARAAKGQAPTEQKTTIH